MKPNTDDLVRHIADRLVRLAAEHGVPNNFAPSEIAQAHAYVTPMQVGRYAPLVVERLRGRGWTVSYVNRHFAVERCQDPQPATRGVITVRPGDRKPNKAEWQSALAEQQQRNAEQQAQDELARITEQAATLGLPLWSKGQVDWLTARLHVSTTDAEVRAHFLARMTSAGWTDAMREEAIAYALACHAANREVYRRVSVGDFE